MAAPKKPANEDKSSIRKELAIRHIINDLLDGAVFSVIITKLTEDGYEVGKKYCRSTAINMFKEARKRIKADFEEQLPEIKSNLTNMLYDLFTEAKQVGDRMNAIKAIQEIAKLTGAYEAQKQDITIKDLTIDFNLLNNED